MSRLPRLLSLAALASLAAWALLAPAQDSAKAKGYALLVGVKEYDHAGLGKLAYPENDVEELAKLLDRPGSPFHKRVRVLTNTRGKKDKKDLPTAANVRKALGELVKDRKKNETVLLALAGHGLELTVKDPAEKGDDKSFPYFCPTDAQLLGASYKTGKHDKLLNLNHLMDQLGDCGARDKLVLIDACRNEMKARGAKRSLGVKKTDVPDGVAVLFACKRGEVAWESDDLKHGLFFHSVLEGLRGKAKDTDGDVTWNGLAGFVMKQVGREAKKLGDGAEQTPHKVESLEGESPLLLRPGAVAKAEEKAITNSIGMKLVRIPAGKFKMGSFKSEQDDAIADYEKIAGSKASATIIGHFRAEGPRHEVKITKAFYLGVYEVTQEEFEAVMGYNPSYFSTNGTKKDGAKYSVDPAGGKDKVKGLSAAERQSLPVENVRHEEAEEFCKKLTALKKEKEAGRKYRLPTEAEWEYSCRGGAASSKPFHYGDSLSSKQANYNGNYPYGGAEKGEYLARTAKVGSYKPNAFGLYDLHGNVWEWCADWYDKDHYATSEKDDPVGPAKDSDRVMRGGSWGSGARGCRSAYRGRRAPASRLIDLGFRVALVPSGQE